ncbi:MAG: LysR family transcriptional regulator [Bacillota bacterium]
MNANLRYFLIVAEEHSITRAAQKAYVSPQSMSAHIKRLEQGYGVQLFIRRPSFQLTSEGEVLYESLKKIQLMELDVEKRLSDIGQGLAGTVRLGIDMTRGKRLLQEIYPQFHEKYPDIVIEMVNGFTPDLIPRIIRGDLHFMFGKYWMNDPELESIFIQKEQYFYVVSDFLLKKHYGAGWERQKIKMESGVDMKEVQNIPLILTGETSYMYQQITRLFREHHMIPQIVFQSNTHIINLEMAASGFGACFCPGMLTGAPLSRMVSYDGKAGNLCAYPLKDFKESHDIAVVYRKNGYLPSYVNTLIRWIVETYQQ